MSSDETGHVYRLHSTLELPLEDVREYFDDAPDLPANVDAVDITRRNNTLILKAIAEDKVSKYTPSAQLKASVTEVRVYEEDPDEVNNGPTWGDEEEEEIESELVEFAAFKGDRETVLQNSLLQYEMFQVLREIARLADKGTLTAITSKEDELMAHRVVDGEDRPAKIEVVEGPGDKEDGKNGVNWRDNKFIS